MAAQAFQAWWRATPPSLSSLAAIVAAHVEELSCSAGALETAWLAWELAQPTGAEKQRLRARLGECAAAQGLFLPGADQAQVNALLEARRRVAPQPKLAVQLAPKFYTPGDPRPFSGKLELDRLRRRKQRWEKKLGAELLATGRAEHRAGALRAAKRDHEAQRRANRVANALQQQKKIIERENTSGLLGEAARPRKKRRR